MIKGDEITELQDDQNNKEEMNKSNDSALDFDCENQRTFV